MTSGYCPFVNTINWDVSGNFVVIMPDDPIFDGVDFEALTYFHNINFAHPLLDTAATLLATDGNEINMIARNETGRIIGLNLCVNTAACLINPGYDVNNEQVYKLLSNSLLLVSNVIMQVDIDIKPGSDPNSINCYNDKGIITLAILTTDDFDATTVDHSSVTFEEASETHIDSKSGHLRRHEEDVDGDGDTDLVFHFRQGDTDLTCESVDGTLTGETFDGQTIEGTDAVNMVPAR
jgi:hypothetical protein